MSNKFSIAEIREALAYAITFDSEHLFDDLPTWVVPKLLENIEKYLSVNPKSLDAYRQGYEDGVTAFNTVGTDALGHCEFHLNRWLETK